MNATNVTEMRVEITSRILKKHHNNYSDSDSDYSDSKMS